MWFLILCINEFSSSDPLSILLYNGLLDNEPNMNVLRGIDENPEVYAGDKYYRP